MRHSLGRRLSARLDATPSTTTGFTTSWDTPQESRGELGQHRTGNVASLGHHGQPPAGPHGPRPRPPSGTMGESALAQAQLGLLHASPLSAASNKGAAWSPWRPWEANAAGDDLFGLTAGGDLGQGTGNGANGTNGANGATASPLERLRLWRHDALLQHLYDTALFVGEKAFALSADANDGFWLAMAFSWTGQWERCQALLLRGQEGARLVDSSLACRALAAQALAHQNRWPHLLELVGDVNPFRATKSTKPLDLVPAGHQADDEGIRLESTLCLLRGHALFALGQSTAAREAYQEALEVDAKNFSAFQSLVVNRMLTTHEARRLLHGLTSRDADVVRGLYALLLDDDENDNDPSSSDTASASLVLENDSHQIRKRALQCFKAAHYEKALALTQAVISKDPSHPTILPLHITTLYTLQRANELFLLGHRLTELVPHSASAWYAVGAYYLATARPNEARRFFGQATLIEPEMMEAWIGFAETFVQEGEYGQAITAYGTASRLFQQSHLPPLYIGMQHLALNNLKAAEDYLNSSASLTTSCDPQVLNEKAVVAYHSERYDEALTLFRQAMDWTRTHSVDRALPRAVQTNLGHCLRRMGKYQEAAVEFAEILVDAPNDALAMTAAGLCSHAQGDVGDAIVKYHLALASGPGDVGSRIHYDLAMTSDLLKLALEDNAAFSTVQGPAGEEEEAEEAEELEELEDLSSTTGPQAGPTVPTSTSPSILDRQLARSDEDEGRYVEDGASEAEGDGDDDGVDMETGSDDDG